MADREMTSQEAIEILCGIRACFNFFNVYDEPKYAALTKAIFALKAEPIKQDNVKNELLAKIVNNSPICRNCDIYRDAWNVCFMASECLTNGFKFCKRRKDEVENDR